VTDPDKLKAFAKEKITGWLTGIDAWSNKRPDDQLDDAGAFAADAVIDGAVGLGMGAAGKGLGGVVGEAGTVTRAERKAAEVVTHSRAGTVSKADSHVWKKLKSARGKTKTDGERFYEWDHTHGDIEVYDRRGLHLGSMDPSTGAMSKPSVPGRKINL
jgi:hypothetical protein